MNFDVRPRNPNLSPSSSQEKELVHLQLGSTYEFTLASGRKILVVVFGSKQQPTGHVAYGPDRMGD